MSFGSFSLVFSIVLVSMICRNSSQFVLEVWSLGLDFFGSTVVLIVAMIGVWSEVRSRLAVMFM